MLKTTIEVIMVIVGAFIGAGFASGQEINVFFYKNGMYGLYGLIFSCILISYAIYKSIKIILKHNITNYKEFINVIFQGSQSRALKCIDIVINVLILMIFFIMIAGFGAYMQQEIGIHSLIGSGILAVITYFVLINNVEGVVNLSKYIVPTIIMMIVVIGISNIKNIGYFNVKYENDINKLVIALKDAILYASYNLIFLIPVLIALKEKIMKASKKVAFFIGAILLILGIIIFSLLITINVPLHNIEMPAVYAITQNYSQFKIIYGIIILASIFTSAISLGISFLNNVCKNARTYPQVASIMCITSLIFSKIGFSKLINLLYPIFGIIGIIQIYKIIKKK